MVTKKEIYPWWNILFTTGTNDDCEEWWWELNVEEKIKVFNDWYKGGEKK